MRPLWLVLLVGCSAEGLQDPYSVTLFDTQEAWLDPAEATDTDPPETESDVETDTEGLDTDTAVPMDESGCTADVEIDEEVDGTVEETERWVYDDDAQLSSYARYDADGDLLESWSGTYGAYGLVLEEEDTNGDGTIDLIRTTTWDSAGRIEQVQTDNGGDGDIDLTESYTYPDATELKPSTRTWAGTSSGTDVYTWVEDVGGDHLDLERFEGDDADATALVTAEWDATHGLVYWLEDTDADGNYDTMTHYTHNWTTSLLIGVRVRTYEDGTKVGEHQVGYARDPQGFIMSLSHSGHEADGAEISSLHTYSWDCPE